MTRPPIPSGERLVRPLVPAALPARPRPRTAPLPALPARVALPASVNASELLLGMALPSRCGRVTEQHLLHALRWQPGRRLGIQVYNGLLVVGSADDGRHRVGSRGALPLPASARRMCGIEPGQPVLLAALVTSDLLVIHSVSTLARLVADLHAQMPGGAHVC